METLSPTSSLRLRFDQLSPENDGDTANGVMFWNFDFSKMKIPNGLSVPYKFESWYENGVLHRREPIMFKGLKVLKKVE